MSQTNDIVLENVSKFYGEVLGVNRVNLSIPSGITGLVGPNGSGKSTLMNLLTGLLSPSQGRIHVRGIPPTEPEKLFRIMGYCTQFDSFPNGATGRQFIYGYLRVHGMTHTEARDRTDSTIERVSLSHAADRRVAGYSKGMRQRIKLAQAIAHDPMVLVLDEPLNGLDPMVRAETIELFREHAQDGRHVIISSHILHEVDLISDQVILLNEGYIVAEGDIMGVRGEMQGHPMKIQIRVDRPAQLASAMFEQDNIVEVCMHEDRQGLMVSTRDADGFLLTFNDIVMKHGFKIQSVMPSDANVDAVYEYLIGDQRDGS